MFGKTQNCGEFLATGCTEIFVLGHGTLGLLQDRDVGVGVFPQREEIIVGGLRLGGVAGESVGASEAQMGELNTLTPEPVPRFSACGCAAKGIFDDYAWAAYSVLPLQTE
jgi:hypothetical protein